MSNLTFKDSNNTEWVLLPFKKRKKDKREIAIAYFHLLAAFNDIKLSESEVKLLAHISLNKG
ncbi:MAG: hypothetical protein WCO06_07400, partial [Candidatus Roizmanbacteria bacterium]